ncbi:YlbF family regulator [Staphylococcus massiliensis]|uniref:YmcA protein n=1 Tax=Staphylococcus massiliensis S46 TaxID=1229783 RepID=K9ASY9_9STAP|nr:YlbF family regulator [Staphylococcus massiliensis]EKU50513.1 hypothetical protein C273_00790 [Staphylococcus massiliensis S46]MCG3398716.1 YlbF family regulator [Staphylococcus massiliensis]MCG3401277.1 YlbF family regulator [Staphylococcus massiliensis]MCG3412546.1 YlbF family regulator [Staphylococcus massiliensis]POA00383.1 hypothetical protein CD133_04645 [Staphylococcus massiliensis CCUG 55927]
MYSKDDIIQEANRISLKIQDLDMIQDYKRVEDQIHHNQRLDAYMKRLKMNQKQSVNLQNYGKETAFNQSESHISDIQKKIDALPIVGEFKVAQQDANTFLHSMVDILNDEMNH